MKNNITPKNIIIVHHNADNDGIMSGVIAYNMYREEVETGYVKLYGYGYETSHKFMDEVNPDGNTNKQFQFIDVTPPLDWLNSIKDELEYGTINIQIFDHHYRKFEEIQNLKLPGLSYVFNNENCGAQIYLNHWLEIMNGNLCNNDNVSRLFDAKIQMYVSLVDCYDTWKFVQMKEDNTHILAFHEYFDMFNTVESFNAELERCTINEVFEKGQVLVERILKKDIPKQINSLMVRDVSFVSKNGTKGSPIQVLFLSGSSSYLSQKALNEAFPGKILAFAYYNVNIESKSVSLSFRSNISNTIDCALLARRFNPTGGGHKEAAGCKVDLETFFEIIKEQEFDGEEPSTKLIEIKKLVKTLKSKYN